MTFCISGRIALFTLRFETQMKGGDGDDMVTEGSGDKGNGSVIVFYEGNVIARPLSSCVGGATTTPPESAVR